MCVSLESSKAYKFHAVSRFTDDLCARNDGNKFLALLKKIHLNKLEFNSNTKVIMP